MTGRPSDEAAQEIQRARDRLQVISDVTRRFAEATTDYQRLLDDVARSLAEVIQESCVLFLCNGDGSALEAAALHDADARMLHELRSEFEGRPMVLSDQPLLSEILTTGQPLLVPRTDSSTPRTDSTEGQIEWQRRLGLHSFLIVPLRVGGRSLGLLALGRFRAESPAFDEHDRELAQNVADHASLAIENARLFAAAQEARRVAEEAKEAMRRSEAAHRQLFDSSPIAIFVMDAASRQMLAANTAALNLYGYSLEEFLKLDLSDLRHPDDQARLETALQALGEADNKGSGQHRRKDGSVLHVVGGSHLATFEGRPARIVFVSDESDRVRAERERDASRQRLERTLDDISEGYTIMDGGLRYVYMNKAGAEHTHLSREQLIGHTPMELYPGFEGSKIHQALVRVVQGGGRERIEEEFLHADGATGYFELTIQPVPEGLVVLSVDATDRRRAELRRDALEEQLRQSQKMQAVGRLAGGVAHDFNNLLSVILGYGADILTRLEPGDPLRSDIEEIHRAGSRAAELTKQLLLFSRQQVLEPKVLDLNDVIGSMERMLRRVLGEHLVLDLQLAPRLGRIRADRSNTEQVILNLAVNARDAMPSGGRLTIETANVNLDAAFVQSHLGVAPGPYVHLTMTDTGSGMDKATIARIFEPFFSTKEQGKGTGLGLSTVFGIVQQSGGGVWVDSELGRGTSFNVYLPRLDAAPEARSVAPDTNTLHGDETVLLVEDEEQVRAVARRILERYGYRVLVAQSPEHAIHLCESHTERIHLLLTDVVMPRIGGAELAGRLLARRTDLKVLYVSGYTDGNIAPAGVLEEGPAFLQKPFTSELLARKVRSVLDA